MAINHSVGSVWQKWKNKISDVLQYRNFSFLAHGMTPLSKEDYQKMAEPVWQFINECDRVQALKEELTNARQLPKTL